MNKRVQKQVGLHFAGRAHPRRCRGCEKWSALICRGYAGDRRPRAWAAAGAAKLRNSDGCRGGRSAAEEKCIYKFRYPEGAGSAGGAFCRRWRRSIRGGTLSGGIRRTSGKSSDGGGRLSFGIKKTKEGDFFEINTSNHWLSRK